MADFAADFYSGTNSGMRDGGPDSYFTVSPSLGFILLALSIYDFSVHRLAAFDLLLLLMTWLTSGHMLLYDVFGLGRAIPDYMPWRDPDSVITDPKPPVGSYDQSKVQRLSVFVMKLSDMPKGLWASMIFYVYMSGMDLAATTPNTKVLAKAEASKKRKASNYGLDPRKSDDEESDDDPDACVEILLVIPIHPAITIPLGGNQSEGSIPSAAEGPRKQGSRGKAIMDDSVDISSRSVAHPRGSTGPSLVWDPTSDTINRDFFPFIPEPYYADYPKDGIIGGSYEIMREWWEVPTLGEMVRIKALSDEQLFGKISILHCLMMSYRGELLARYRCFLKSHDDHVSNMKKQVTDLNEKVTTSDAAFVKNEVRIVDARRGNQSAAAQTYLGDIHASIHGYKHSLAEKNAEILRLKDSPPEFASFFQGGFQGLVQNFLASDEFSRVKSELLSLTASVGFERGLRMDLTQELIVDYSAHPLSILLKFEIEKLARPAAIPAPKVAGVSPPPPRESNVTPASSFVKFLSNDAPFFCCCYKEAPSRAERGDVNRADTSSIQDLKLASSSFPNVIVALFVEKEKENAPHNSQDTPMIPPVDAEDASASSRV
ncbi:hypothetical protein Tco_0943212 [Tanacetum coccineum]